MFQRFWASVHCASVFGTRRGARSALFMVISFKIIGLQAPAQAGIELTVHVPSHCSCTGEPKSLNSTIDSFYNCLEITIETGVDAQLLTLNCKYSVCSAGCWQ
jgi:hypothetical protein